MLGIWRQIEDIIVPTMHPKKDLEPKKQAWTCPNKMYDQEKWLKKYRQMKKKIFWHVSLCTTILHMSIKEKEKC